MELREEVIPGLPEEIGGALVTVEFLASGGIAGALPLHWAGWQLLMSRLRPCPRRFRLLPSKSEASEADGLLSSSVAPLRRKQDRLTPLMLAAAKQRSRNRPGHQGHQPDSREDRPDVFRRWTFIALVLVLLVFPVRAQEQPRPAPTHAEVPYADVHKRNVLDFWQVESSEPAPLVVFIHGGGFQSFSKDRVNADFLREFLDAGIAVAAINYRLVQHEIFPAAFHDARRALQFLRSKAIDWNTDKSRIGAYGGSAGAMISMWLAFHNEMADPGSEDPVERESTRLALVATQGGQLTFDRRWMEQWVPGNIIHKNPAFLRLFGVKSLQDLDRPDIQRWVRELSPITHLTADDPPIFMTYGMAPDALVPTDPKKIKPWALHHVIFGVTLKVRMEALGIESDLRYPGATSTYRSIPQFFIRKFEPEQK